jgi:hypothetical protein
MVVIDVTDLVSVDGECRGDARGDQEKRRLQPHFMSSVVEGSLGVCGCKGEEDEGNVVENLGNSDAEPWGFAHHHLDFSDSFVYTNFDF